MLFLISHSVPFSHPSLLPQPTSPTFTVGHQHTLQMPPYATGSCLCTAVTYTLATAPTTSYLCVCPPTSSLPSLPLTQERQHCPACKKSSGSAFAHNASLPSTSFTLTSGSSSLKSYTDNTTSSGKPLRRFFCAECGCPVRIEADCSPGRVFVMVGCLDGEEGREGLVPEKEHWSQNRVGWFAGLGTLVGGSGRKKRRRG